MMSLASRARVSRSGGRSRTRVAALKAADEAERRQRAEFDAETLVTLHGATEAALVAAQEVERLCGDLVSDLSHHALKAQAQGGPSVHLSNVLTIVQQSLTAVEAYLARPVEG